MAGLSFVWAASKRAIINGSTTFVRQMELPDDVYLPMPCRCLSCVDYTP